MSTNSGKLGEFENEGAWNMARAYENIPNQELLTKSVRAAQAKVGKTGDVMAFGRCMIVLPVKSASYFRNQETGEQTLSIGVGSTRVNFVGDLVTMIVHATSGFDQIMSDLFEEWRQAAIQYSRKPKPNNPAIDGTEETA